MLQWRRPEGIRISYMPGSMQDFDWGDRFDYCKVQYRINRYRYQIEMYQKIMTDILGSLMNIRSSGIYILYLRALVLIQSSGIYIPTGPCAHSELWYIYTYGLLCSFRALEPIPMLFYFWTSYSALDLYLEELIAFAEVDRFHLLLFLLFSVLVYHIYWNKNVNLVLIDFFLYNEYR